MDYNALSLDREVRWFIVMWGTISPR